MLISCVLQCTDGLRLIKRLENYAYRMSEKTAYRSLEKSAYRSLKKLLTVHLQIHLTACIYLQLTRMMLWQSRVNYPFIIVSRISSKSSNCMGMMEVN